MQDQNAIYVNLDYLAWSLMCAQFIFFLYVYDPYLYLSFHIVLFHLVAG